MQCFKTQLSDQEQKGKMQVFQNLNSYHKQYIYYKINDNWLTVCLGKKLVVSVKCCYINKLYDYISK